MHFYQSGISCRDGNPSIVYSKNIYQLFISLFIFCLAPLCMQAQNLVPNPGFENRSSSLCPTDNDQLERCADWYNPITRGVPDNYRATTDYYHGCCTNGVQGVPLNRWGNYRDASSGEAYVGLALGKIAMDPGQDEEYREYATAQLTSDLIVGRYYKVSFKVHYMTSSDNAICNIGAFFSNFDPALTPPLYQNGTFNHQFHSPLPFVPQIWSTMYQTPPYQFLDKDVWQTVEGIFQVTDNNKRWITIGNFQPTVPISEIKGTTGGPNNDWWTAYYFIDDVSVEDVTDYCTCSYKVSAVPKENCGPGQCGYAVTITANILDCPVTNIELTLRDLSGQQEPGSTVISQNVNLQPGQSITIDYCTPEFMNEHRINIALTRQTRDGIITEPCNKQVAVFCRCDCEDLKRHNGINLDLRQATDNECCWEIYFNNPMPCEVENITGIVLKMDSPVSSITAVPPGWNFLPLPDGDWFLKNNNNVPLPNYAAPLVLGKICFPTNTFPELIELKYTLDNNGIVYCDLEGNAKLTVVRGCQTSPEACCAAFDVNAVQKSGSGISDCAFDLFITRDPQIYGCSVQKLEVYENVDGNLVSLYTETGFPITFGSGVVTTLSPSQKSGKFTIVFKDNSGVLCVHDIDFECDASPEECCEAITLTKVYDANAGGPGCCADITIHQTPLTGCEIYNVQVFAGEFVNGQYQANSTVTTLTGTPLVINGAKIRVCPGISSYYKLEFRDANNNLICEKFIYINCLEITPVGGGGGTNKNGSFVPQPTDNPDRLLYTIPNPSSDEATVFYTVEAEGKVELSLFNAVGELVSVLSTTHLTPGTYSLPVRTDKLPNGTYYVKFRLGDTVISTPLVVLH